MPYPTKHVTELAETVCISLSTVFVLTSGNWAYDEESTIICLPPLSLCKQGRTSSPQEEGQCHWPAPCLVPTQDKVLWGIYCHSPTLSPLICIQSLLKLCWSWCFFNINFSTPCFLHTRKNTEREGEGLPTQLVQRSRVLCRPPQLPAWQDSLRRPVA